MLLYAYIACLVYYKGRLIVDVISQLSEQL